MDHTRSSEVSTPPPTIKLNGFKLGLGGCPFAGGNGAAAGVASTSTTNNNHSQPSGAAAAAAEKADPSRANIDANNNTKPNGSLKSVYQSFKLGENTSQKIPKGGMLYGDYLQVG